MADIVSSDGHCTARLHTNWASVLIWTDLTGSITVRRNGIDLATMDTGRQIYYDHYFTPLGQPSSYTVTNGTTTSTAATITVPIDPQHRTWLKSGVDPNLSLPLLQRPLEDVTRDQQLGVFPIVGSSEPFVVFGSLGARETTATFTATTAAQRDGLEALLAASSPIYYQPCPDTGERAMWAAVRRVSQGWQQVGSLPGDIPGHQWSLTLSMIECPQPVGSTLGNIIPGWGWDDVWAVWPTWDAIKAACPTWNYLVQAGVA